jgi:tetratricopeptide (TPR) repeat protein
MKTLLALAGILICAPQSRAQETLSDALRKAVIEEDVNHNLDAAIKQYRAIVEQFRDDRNAAATAQFRLIDCYRKLGKTAEADAAYNELVRQFPERTDLAAQSRRLRAVPAAPSAPSTAEQDILRQKYDLAIKHLAEVKHQMELGLVGSTSVEEAEADILRAQLEMVDRSHRQPLLEQLVGLAQNALAHQEKLYFLGVVSSQSVDQKKKELLDAQQELLRNRR